MKFRTIMTGMCMMTFICGAANAVDFFDTAQVISATPIYQSVPQQVCQNQTVVTQAPPSQGNGIVGGILGGLAGGLLGAQVGHGSGKTAATIVGAGGGAIIGNQIANSPSPPTTQTVQTCNNVMSNIVTGYTVVYQYNGRAITTTLPYNPGSYVKVGVGAVNEGGASRQRAMPPPPPPGY